MLWWSHQVRMPVVSHNPSIILLLSAFSVSHRHISMLRVPLPLRRSTPALVCGAVKSSGLQWRTLLGVGWWKQADFTSIRGGMRFSLTIKLAPHVPHRLTQRRQMLLEEGARCGERGWLVVKVATYLVRNRAMLDEPNGVFWITCSYADRNGTSMC